MSMWRLSAGTANIIGKKKAATHVHPSTAYIMIGEKCRNNCKFCAQSQGSSSANNRLSRITWPACEAEQASTGIGEAYAKRVIRRACLQVLDSEMGIDEALAAIKRLQTDTKMPICVSSNIKTVDKARELLANGAERICIPLDAATPDVFNRIKSGSWQEKWDLLIACATEWPGSITTHLIAGLGESEEDMVKTMTECINQGITVGLFAFTPVRGTSLEEYSPQTIGQYRRIQIAHWLLKQGYDYKSIQFNNGCITGFLVSNLYDILEDGSAFQTSGCRDCNRPYFNERPGGVMYNFPRELTHTEVLKAIQESEVVIGLC
ncbi:radical SAM protein [Dendrosporobacter sp. 1207_IL3150]|uniref:radical SAM protein n=1 Tax=Dendrosporobacter sp. 1207_IL3150 TaxID=3084054 RepID=UPI002FDAEBEC